MNFKDMQLIEPVFKAIKEEGYLEPTPIQVKAIPPLLKGKDLIGIAQTGTGKTAAFVLPLLQKLNLNNKLPLKNSPRALILTPTRELAAQIEKSCKTYGKFMNIKTTVIYGGVSQIPQVKALYHGVNILVATPGRLLDLIRQRHIYLDDVETFILDEADRMLDMGFINDIRSLLPLLPGKHQTIMFSATMSRDIEELAQDFLKEPVHIEVSTEDSTFDRIKQDLFFVERTQKLELLIHLLKKDLKQVLIFTRTKAGANRVTRALVNKHIAAEAIHGDKTQAQRKRALENFQRGKTILVATDIAARGINVIGISHIINYDLPNEPENYIHRIGRTARAGANGTAFSFCDETEKDYLNAIEREIGQRLQFVKHIFHSELAQYSTQPPPQRGGSMQRNRSSNPRSNRSRNGNRRFRH